MILKTMTMTVKAGIEKRRVDVISPEVDVGTISYADSQKELYGNISKVNTMLVNQVSYVTVRSNTTYIFVGMT